MIVIKHGAIDLELPLSCRYGGRRKDGRSAVVMQQWVPVVKEGLRSTQMSSATRVYVDVTPLAGNLKSSQCLGPAGGLVASHKPSLVRAHLVTE